MYTWFFYLFAWLFFYVVLGNFSANILVPNPVQGISSLGFSCLFGYHFSRYSNIALLHLIFFRPQFFQSFSILVMHSSIIPDVTPNPYTFSSVWSLTAVKISILRLIILFLAFLQQSVDFILLIFVTLACNLCFDSSRTTFSPHFFILYLRHIS